jgi:hypothetical protein
MFCIIHTGARGASAFFFFKVYNPHMKNPIIFFGNITIDLIDIESIPPTYRKKLPKEEAAKISYCPNCAPNLKTPKE